jgi:hypothetical protein
MALNFCPDTAREHDTRRSATSSEDDAIVG